MENWISTRGPILSPPGLPNFRSMNEQLAILLALAVLALSIYRQMRTRPVGEGRALVLPLVLIALGAAQGHLVDGDHAALSIWLLAGELVVGVVLGLVRAYTMRIWRDESGRLWRRGTPWTIAAWIVAIATRAGFVAAGISAGVALETGSILIFFGLSLVVQAVAVVARARSTAPPAAATVKA
ncbi:hypothetical protein Psi02_05850 [Planotetraspora silvatica]|uniref:DUF1453 domain-containing protein n=2 Tax=Planotetraspora silvatica TaxID=234614 RepID=A0A8J3UIZ4_9ACTN|nr:hypothetical protein Psi02_05850 [Planotetraspora silvatica]